MALIRKLLFKIINFIKWPINHRLGDSYFVQLILETHIFLVSIFSFQYIEERPPPTITASFFDDIREELEAIKTDIATVKYNITDLNANF